MQRVAFKMKLIPGHEAEYQLRHDLIWSELKSLLHSKGISDYSIFLDESTGDLFGVLHIEDSLQLDALPAEPIMRRWWDYMKDLMDCNPDNSPVSIPLKEVFYMS